MATAAGSCPAQIAEGGQLMAWSLDEAAIRCRAPAGWKMAVGGWRELRRDMKSGLIRPYLQPSPKEGIVYL
jgi:hypothetical protein